MASIKVAINGRIPNYKEVVEKVYKESKTEAKNVKSKITENIDPIHQKFDKYKPKENKSYALVRHHKEVFCEKEPITHKKFFPQKNNISFDMNSIPNPNEYKFHIKTKPEIHNVQSENYIIKSERGKKTFYNNINKNNNYNTNDGIPPAGQKSENIKNMNKRRKINQHNTSDLLTMQPQNNNNDTSFSYQHPYIKHNRFESESTFDRIFTTYTPPSISTKPKQYKPQRFANTKLNDSVGGILCNNNNTNTNNSVIGYNYKEITAKPNTLNFRELSNYVRINKPEKYGHNMYKSQF